MVLYENGKRICSRGVVFFDEKVLLLERHRLTNGEMLNYYAIPGGGVEDEESFQEASVREMEEECSIKTKAIKYLGKEEFNEGIVHWYYLEYLSGEIKLGGEELLHNSPTNNYKVILVDINDLETLNILGEGKKRIIEAYHYYKNKD